jgi:hypothetical protein
MAQKDTYQPMTISAQKDGLSLGMYWIFTMGMFICQFAVPVCSSIWLFLMLYTPFFVGSMMARYAQRERDGVISFASGYLYSFTTYSCGALILSLVFWVYLRYMDDGYLIDKYTSMLTDPQSQDMMKKIGYSEEDIKDVKQLGEQMSTQLRSMRPIDITLQFLWVNLVTSGFIALISSLYGKMILHFRRKNRT